MGRRALGSIRRRGRVWWLRYQAHGQRIEESSGTGDERTARALLAQRRRELAEGTWTPPGERAAAAHVERLEVELEAARIAQGTKGVTVRAFLEQRIAKRSGVVRSARNEAHYFRAFVIPTLGAMELAKVERAHVRDMMAGVRGAVSPKTGQQLAARTVLHVYRAFSAACADAVLDGVIAANPCTLRARRGELPVKGQGDRKWRSSSVYSLAEIEQLVTSPAIPADRRTMYALEALLGVRSAEACGLRWGDYEPAAVPLGRMLVERQADGAKGERPTKTGEVRDVPVHPALARLLDAWRREGFPMLFGRRPTSADPIVPTRNDMTGRSFRVPTSVHNRLLDDCDRLGLPRRRWAQHALRASFLTLLENAEANVAIGRRATHAAPADVVGGYIRVSWGDLCREVAKMPLAVGQSVGQSFASAAPTPENKREADGPSRGRTGPEPKKPGESGESAPPTTIRGRRDPSRIPEVADTPPATWDTLSPIQVLEAAVVVLRGMGEERRASALERVIASRRAAPRRRRRSSG